LFLTLGLVAIFEAVWPLNDVVSFPWTVVAVLAYVANWVSFPTNASLGYLGHVWSLSIEEQFYALWPLVLVVLPLERIRARWLGFLCGVGIVMATVFTAFVYLWLRPPGEGMSYSTFTHVPAILLGCLLALPARHGIVAGRLSSEWVAAAAGVALLAMMLVVRKDAGYMYLGGYCLAGLFAALLIANLASSAASWISGLFSIPGLQAVGKVSYGLYLYHLPIVLFTEAFRTHGWANFLWVTVLRLILIFGLAFASYHLVEQRFLRLKSHMTPARSGSPSTLGLDEGGR
jgi:peptidoglycan/LPS O-acetylase OafA/YrhL